MINIRQVSQSFEEAKLQEATNELKKNSTKITSDMAVSLFNKCSCTLSKANVKNMKESELRDYLLVILKHLKSLGQKRYKDYLISSHWIVKYLIQMNFWDIILNLEPYIVSPTFAPTQLADDEKGYCRTTTLIIYNAFIGLPYSKNTLKIAKMILNLSSISISTCKYLDMCYNCVLVLHKNSPKEHIQQYYMHAMDMLTMLPNDETDTFPRFFKFFTHTLELFLVPPYTGCLDVYKKTATIATIVYTQNHYKQAVNLFEYAVNLLPGETNNQDLTFNDTAINEIVHTPSLDKNTLNSVYLCLYKFIHKLIGTDFKSTWPKRSQASQMAIIHFLIQFEISFMQSEGFEKPTYFILALELLKCSTYNLFLTNSHFTEALETYTSLKKFNKITVCKEFCNAMYNFLIFLHKAKPPGFPDVIKCSDIALDLIEDSDLVFSILKLVLIHLYHAGSYEKCLALSALIFYLPNAKASNDFNTWCSAKTHLRHKEDFYNLTMFEALSYFEKYLHTFVSINFRQIDEAKKISMLQAELIGYKNCWQSKVPMFKVVQELSRLNVSVAADMIVDVFDESIDVHVDFGRLCRTVLKEYELLARAEMCDRSRLNLAVLYYLIFKYTNKDLIKSNTAEVEQNQTVLEENFKKEHENSFDELESARDCDVAANYTTLRLSNHLNVLKWIIQSVDEFELLVSSGSVPFERRSRVLNVLINIIVDFDLNKYSLYMQKSREILLKFSECLDGVEKLRAISFCMESMSMESLAIVLKCGDELVQALEVERNVILMYFVTKTKVLLKNDQKESAYECSKRAEQLLRDVSEEDQSVSVYRAQMCALKTKFIEELGDQLVIKELHNAFALSLKYMYDKKYDPKRHWMYELCVLLEIGEEYIRSHWTCSFTNDLRFYVKSLILICQKSVLPLSSMQFLCDVTESYTKDSRFEDTALKVREMSEMLSLPPRGLKHETLETKEVREKNNNIDIILQIEETLRKPLIYKKGNSSPDFRAPLFRLPSFLTHSSECFCYWCNCVEYHRYVLKVMHLKALNFMYQEQHDSADTLFKAAIQICKILVDNLGNYADKRSMLIKNSNLMNFHRDKTVEINFLLLKDYSKNLYAIDKSQAITMVDTLISMLKSIKERHSSLSNYKMSLMFKPLEQKPKKQNQIDYLTVPETVIIKTPETNASQVVIKPSKYSPNNINVRKHVVKRLNLDVSDDDETNSSVVVLPTTSKTPGVNMKFAIYSEIGAKSSKKTKETPATGKNSVRKTKLAMTGTGAIRKTRAARGDKKTNDEEAGVSEIQKKIEKVLKFDDDEESTEQAVSATPVGSRKFAIYAGNSAKSDRKMKETPGTGKKSKKKDSLAYLREFEDRREKRLEKLEKKNKGDTDVISKGLEKYRLNLPEDQAGCSKAEHLKSQTSRLAVKLKKPIVIVDEPMKLRSTAARKKPIPKRDLFDELKDSK